MLASAWDFKVGSIPPFALSPELDEGSKGVVRQAHHERVNPGQLNSPRHVPAAKLGCGTLCCQDRSMRPTHLLLVVLAITLLPRLSFAESSAAAEILITAFHNKQWQVRYDLPHPTKEMVFARSPDDSRKQTWLADELFEIAETDHGEVVHRKDGAEFTTLRIRMSAEYRALPNDYAPFSPLGDGGMLFHTGRFFACSDVCPKDAKWSMSLWADPKDTVVLDGKRESYYVQWNDWGNGRMIYVGPAAGAASTEASRATQRKL
jgi:hypothetical protein